MKDSKVMERLETAHHLDEHAPDLFLREVRPAAILRPNLAQEVPAVGVFHHDAQGARGVLEERLLVADYVRVVYRGQNAHFVDRVLLLFQR